MKGFNDYNKKTATKGNKTSKMEDTNEETYMKGSENKNAYIGFEDVDPAYPDVSYPEGGGEPAGVGKVNDNLIKESQRIPKTRAEMKLEMKLNKAEEKAKKSEIAKAKKEEKRMSRSQKPSFLMNLAKYRDDLKEKIEYKKEHKDEIKEANAAQRKLRKEEKQVANLRQKLKKEPKDKRKRLKPLN